MNISETILEISLIPESFSSPALIRESPPQKAPGERQKTLPRAFPKVTETHLFSLFSVVPDLIPHTDGCTFLSSDTFGLFETLTGCSRGDLSVLVEAVGRPKDCGYQRNVAGRGCRSDSGRVGKG